MTVGRSGEEDVEGVALKLGKEVELIIMSPVSFHLILDEIISYQFRDQAGVSEIQVRANVITNSRFLLLK